MKSPKTSKFTLPTQIELIKDEILDVFGFLQEFLMFDPHISKGDFLIYIYI